MSETILRYVPQDPFWQPSDAGAEKAISFLKTLAPQADSVEALFEDEVIFYDPGENWSGIECNACGADAEPWWNDAMDVAYAGGFRKLDVKAACCGANTSLNDLRYVWPAAFGRFALEALNPNIDDPTQEQERELSRCLGAPLRKIWVRL